MIRLRPLRQAYPCLYWVLRAWCWWHRRAKPFQQLRIEIDRMQLVLE